MTIDATSASTATSIHAGTTPATNAKKELDQEVFLELLVAQLRNQDPTSPMDTTEMMAQSTQLASMEQLTGLADTSRDAFALQMRIAASGLVGQTVSYVDADGVTQTGIATSVSFEGPVPLVTVGDEKVPLDSVSAVTAAATRVPGTPSDTSTDSDTSGGAATGSTDTAGTAGDAA
ncbi:flagellar hook capping protein [Cellulomonas sp. APG4]|uniref:flagellar hook assembly protein FlgD n=1 Tax=Cellulomonas sp. APG4 TaxID=1538656 RepID=UPI00137A32B1|nr:flagellar hook capping FlgD N-terminal domain-containing protein [Cellulomonas sp. APG4]NCT92649.1 flagellar hook capping protein [Cellulomonas sp. APG4]